MSGKGKNWVLSLAAKTIESAFFGGLRKMRRKYVDALDGAPDAAVKLFYLYAGMVSLVVVTAIGAVVFPAGLMLLLVELLSSNVNREVIALAILLSLLGAAYLFGGGALVYMIGKYVHTSVRKFAKDFSRGSE